MTKAITEEEFEAMFPGMTFEELSKQAFFQMQKLPEYKVDNSQMAALLVFPCKRSDGSEWTMIIECTAKKIFQGEEIIGNKKITSVTDFGIVSMKISDEEMPDEALDRYNDFLREKQKNNVPLSKH